MGRERPWLHREAAPFLSERAKCSKRQLTLFFFFPVALFSQKLLRILSVC